MVVIRHGARASTGTDENLGKPFPMVAARHLPGVLTGNPKFDVRIAARDLRQQGMESDATDKPVPREINALLSDERLILRETQRAVTPFGGIAVFISFLGKIGFVEAVKQHMPIRWRSPNHIDPTSTFTAFLVSVLVGARRFAHATLFRGDQALHAR